MAVPARESDDRTGQRTRQGEQEAGDVDVVGRRVGALIIDSIVVAVGVMILSALARMGFMEGFLVFGVLLGFLYFWLLEAEWEGQTIGKKALEIAVVKEDGSPITHGDSLIRNLLRIIDGLFYYLVGFLVILGSERNQRIGDILANTIVIRRQADSPIDE